MPEGGFGLEALSPRPDGQSRRMPIRYRVPDVARTSDIGPVGEVGRLSVSALSAPDHAHLGLSTEALRGANANLGSRKAAPIEAAAVIDDDVAAATTAAAAKYR